MRENFPNAPHSAKSSATTHASSNFAVAKSSCARATTSTIFADSDDAELLEIRWQGLRDLMNSDDALRTHINQIYRERALASYLRATPLFKNLSKEQLDCVAEAVEFSTFGDYDWS